MEGFRRDISLLLGLEETYDHSHLQGLGLVNICDDLAGFFLL